MDIIIYAQALETNAPADVYYKDRYVYGSIDEKVDLSEFFKCTYSKADMLKYKTVEYLEEQIVMLEYINKYLYLYILCEERDSVGRYVPIIIQVYREDVDKIFYALDEFLDKSNRHITEKTRKRINKEIEEFIKAEKVNVYIYYFAFLFVLALVFAIVFFTIQALNN